MTAYNVYLLAGSISSSLTLISVNLTAIDITGSVALTSDITKNITIKMTSSEITLQNVNATGKNVYGIANTIGSNTTKISIMLDNTTIKLADITSAYFYGITNSSYGVNTITLSSSNIIFDNINANSGNVYVIARYIHTNSTFNLI